METRPGGLPEGFDVTLESVEIPEYERDEPALILEPFFVDFEDAPLVDPSRASEIEDDAPPVDPSRAAETDDDEPLVLPPTAPRGLRLPGPVVSITAHVLIIAAVLWWQTTPVEELNLVPVEFVIEQPPPTAPQPQPQNQQEAKAAPPGRLASEDYGEVTKTPDAGTGAAVADEQPKPEPTPEAQPAEPEPPKKLTAAIPVPKPIPLQSIPAPPPPKPPVAKPVAPPQPKQPHEAVRSAKIPGPASTRDEYLAYLLTLTKRHLDLLPLSLIGDRRGETVIGIHVLADGTIARIEVAESSGYPDIDRRIEQMIGAVGRFPPLPQWIQSPGIDLQLSLRFPEAVERR